MCEPISIGLGIGAVASGVGIAAQNKAASEQNAYRKRLKVAGEQNYETNKEAVLKDVGLQIDQLGLRELQARAATRLELEGISRAARSASATSAVSFGRSGITGQSVSLLHQQFERDVLEHESAFTRTRENMAQQFSMDAQGIYARGESAINAGTPNPLPPVQTVSPATSIMNGISTGFSVYGALGSFKTPPGVGTGGPSAPPPLLARPQQN